MREKINECYLYDNAMIDSKDWTFHYKLYKVVFVYYFEETVMRVTGKKVGVLLNVNENIWQGMNTKQ